jgi:hypothetical protein
VVGEPAFIFLEWQYFSELARAISCRWERTWSGVPAVGGMPRDKFSIIHGYHTKK